MAQRRSRNRRLSSRRSNVSGILNDDTNLHDNNDPLWFDRTAVRPSTSLRLSKNETAALNPDSTVHASQLSDDWYENLSQSDNSKLLEEAVKNRKSKQLQGEHGDSDQRSAATESESEHEFQKKRAKLRGVRKASHKTSDQSNAFVKALEKTTDSHARNLTHAQLQEGNESESTHDDSRTIRKLRPKFSRRAKNDTNNFEKALESDSASERASTSRKSSRFSKRVSQVNQEFATPEKQKRLTRSTADKIVDKSVEQLQTKSANKSRDKTINESSVRELRSRQIVTPSTSAKSSKKRPAQDQSPDASCSSPEVKRHKRQLFSQGNKSVADKSKGDKSVFDAALDSVNDNQENQATVTEQVNKSKTTESSATLVENNLDNDDDSDSSSIPKNIRRTRSRSLFVERHSGETRDVNSSKNKPGTREKDSSKDKSMASQSNASFKNLTIAESSDDEDIYNSSITRQQKKSNNSVNPQSQVSSVDTDSEDMVDASRSRTQQSEANKSEPSEHAKLQVSSVEMSDDDEDMIDMSPLKVQQKETDTSKKSNKSSDNSSSSEKEDETSKRKSRNKSKEKEIEDTPKLSQRSPKAANKSLKNKSSSIVSNKNDSKADESENETSTIPQHIRRTRSRLFQKSKADEDDNAPDAENVAENELSRKSRASNSSESVIREAAANKSKKEPKIILEKVIRRADSTKNQETRQSNTSLNKEKSGGNSEESSSDHRSVETSSDDTPAPKSPQHASTPFTAPILPNKASKQMSKVQGSAKSAQNTTFDDLLHTPNPAQSTLNPQGKPVNRITQFLYRTFTDSEEQTPPAATAASPKAGPSRIAENNEDIDATDESDVSNCPLISRRSNDVADKENVSRSPAKGKQVVEKSSNNQTERQFDWEKARRHTDAVKVMVEAQMRLAEEARKKRELEKQRIDAKFKRLQLEREADLKRKNKKPVHKAYLVDGKVYKQPKLPRPKPWVTDKLYKFLWKNMEPKYGIRTRVKSEDFVLQLSEFAAKVVKSKSYAKYKNELEQIMITMAKLGIIETRFDFYRFAADFLPYSVREKVVPCMLPGNERNIPYKPELLNVPLLRQEEETDES